MRNYILGIFICLIPLSQVGLCKNVEKEETLKKIALEVLQGEKIIGYYSEFLPKDSLGQPDTTLKDKFHYKYSASILPEFKIEGLHVYQVYQEGLVIDSIHVLAMLPEPEFLVAVSDDSVVYRLAGFDHQGEFTRAAKNLFEKGIPIKENVIPLSVLFYATEVWPLHVKMVSEPHELMGLEEDILCEIDRSDLKTAAKKIKPPTVAEKGDKWGVTLFVIVYSSCGSSFATYLSIRKVNIQVESEIFKVVDDEWMY